jgi:uncharacterized membrane-anchored protein YhcB (DUF1043 family)
MMALLGFILGLLIGAAVYHFFFRLSPAERHQEDQLKEAQLKLKTYHFEVSNYLNKSASMMNQLQGICDQFHDHILEGSVALNLASNKQSALQPAPYSDSNLAITPSTPPKDYA